MAMHVLFSSSVQVLRAVLACEVKQEQANPSSRSGINMLSGPFHLWGEHLVHPQIPITVCLSHKADIFSGVALSSVFTENHDPKAYHLELNGFKLLPSRGAGGRWGGGGGGGGGGRRRVASELGEAAKIQSINVPPGQLQAA